MTLYRVVADVRHLGVCDKDDTPYPIRHPSGHYLKWHTQGETVDLSHMTQECIDVNVSLGYIEPVPVKKTKKVKDETVVPDVSGGDL